MKTVLITVAAMIAGFVAFTLWYSPARIVARARARGVYVPAMPFEYKRRSFV